ncbi:MAG TPA: hypothetical protein VGF32_29015 [Streptosporangiaceae bacterium]|jgi:hypothetical protein
MGDPGHDHDQQASASPETAGGRRLSRRQVMTASAVAAGVGVGSVAAPAEAATSVRDVSLGERGTTTVEFRGRITQSGSSGQQFTGYGYLIRATHATQGDLFDGPPSETTALLTVYATGDLKARVLDTSVHSLDIAGALTVYQRAHPGADFSDPSSFQVGKPVARYDMTLQDVLAVYATAKGLPTLTGDMRQTAAHALSGPLSGYRFGRVGTRLRLFATGLGTLTDPVTLNAQLEIAGNWSIE